MDKPLLFDKEPYEVEVPVTLDLAERARLAVTGLSNMFDPEHNHAAYLGANFCVQPPYMIGESINSSARAL